MISVKQALSIISKVKYNIGTEYIIPEKALGRITSEKVISKTDNPPFNMSAMDGYAVCNKPSNNTYKVVNEIFAGNKVPIGAAPLAQAYAGHQFGNFSPQLGDGRALLLGEIVNVHGHRYDVQLKGSGRTPFSRGGDGKAALGPVLREYLVSEAMNASVKLLGFPSTVRISAW